MELVAILQSAWTVMVMVIFLGVTFWAYSRSRKEALEELGASVLKDDDSVTVTTQGSTHVHK